MPAVRCAAILVFLAGMSATTEPAFRVARGTRQMAAFLQMEVAAAERAISSLPDPDLFELAQSVRNPSEAGALKRLADLHIALARGEFADTVPELTRLVDDNDFARVADGRALVIALRVLGGASLREVDLAYAAVHRPSPLLPVRVRGRAPDAAGEPLARARSAFLRLLAIDPEDSGAQWLLNATAMIEGTYPDSVPDRWRLPGPIGASTSVGRFENVAMEAGIATRGRAGGCITEDFDNDGLIDIVFSSTGLSAANQLRFFHNDGNGRFSDRTDAAGLTGITGGLNITSADFDNDGLVDIFVPRGAWLRDAGRQPPSLLRNRDGWFEDVTEQAGLITFTPAHAVAWADFDNDGWLDLFVGNETTPGDVATPSYLFRNNGDGTFRDVAAQVGVDAVGWIKGATWGDYNNDGWPDLYVARLMGGGTLYRNGGSKDAFRFADVTEQARVRHPLNQYVSWFFDYDNDGWLDLFVASTSSSDFWMDVSNVAATLRGLPGRGDRPRLFRNLGDGTFANVTSELGLDRTVSAMGGNFGDLDADGFPDIYLGTGNPMFYGLMPNLAWHNDAARAFTNVTAAGGFGHLHKGHGVAFADLDGDGDEDIVAVQGGVYSGDTGERLVMVNPSRGRHWLTLRLRGVRSNRGAVGTRIRVAVSGPEGTRVIHARVSTGGSFGASSLQQEIGLGTSERVTSLEIRWPSGLLQRFPAPPIDSVLSVSEGGPLDRVQARRFSFGADGAPARRSK